jgi:hypothetical protein
LILNGSKPKRQRWDIYVTLADRYQWTPEQVDRMDPDFVDEMTAYMNAAVDHGNAELRKARRR